MQTNNQCQEHLTFYFYSMKLCAISNLGWNFDHLSREPIIYLFILAEDYQNGFSLAPCLFDNYGLHCSTIIVNWMIEKDDRVQDCSCEL